MKSRVSLFLTVPVFLARMVEMRPLILCAPRVCLNGLLLLLHPASMERLLIKVEALRDLLRERPAGLVLSHVQHSLQQDQTPSLRATGSGMVGGAHSIGCGVKGAVAMAGTEVDIVGNQEKAGTCSRHLC